MFLSWDELHSELGKDLERNYVFKYGQQKDSSASIITGIDPAHMPGVFNDHEQYEFHAEDDGFQG
jgi:hypothetical protein